MPEPTRIRAQLQGAGAVVRLLMQHEMESGRRKDAGSKVVPAWFIQEMEVALNDKTVLRGLWGPAVSKNPFLQLTIKGAKAGDRVRVSWIDSRGERRSDEALVA